LLQNFRVHSKLGMCLLSKIKKKLLQSLFSKQLLQNWESKQIQKWRQKKLFLRDFISSEKVCFEWPWTRTSHSCCCCQKLRRNDLTKFRGKPSKFGHEVTALTLLTAAVYIRIRVTGWVYEKNRPNWSPAQFLSNKINA
jgi:hypothetical protein